MKILGILRGFPGLGRVVSGVSILERLRDEHGCDVEIISYLQGRKYLASKGYEISQEASPADICSIGLLPTNSMGPYIHNRIDEMTPDLVLIDGEPLILHSLRISHPKLKIVALLNPADVDNRHNDKQSMEYFNALYSMADLAIIHGLRKVEPQEGYCRHIAVGTILRNEILAIRNTPKQRIYCVLGGGTVNTSPQFVDSTLQIAALCNEAAALLPNFSVNFMCSSYNIFSALSQTALSSNVTLCQDIMDAAEYYSDASLVITRSGRNTLSELAYLGIPAVSFVAGCTYRREEQRQNIESIKSDIIRALPIGALPKELADLCLQLMSKNRKAAAFAPGNDDAVNSIMELLFPHMAANTLT